MHKATKFQNMITGSDGINSVIEALQTKDVW